MRDIDIIDSELRLLAAASATFSASASFL